jgi:short-subunit dehydrogenase involved in D-alanine esterification of teichoic acids
MDEQMKLGGVKVLITGGTSGIGLKTVEALIREQAKVVVVARDDVKLKQLAKTYALAGTYCCDLADSAAVVKLGEEILVDHPDLQVLINNAGVQNNVYYVSETSTPRSIEHEVCINLLAPLLLIRVLLPALSKQQEAVIMNITSGLALVPKTSSAVYCGTKGGLRVFSQALRNQLENTSVRVVELLAPVVETPMTAGRGKRKMSPDQVAGQIVAAIKGRSSEVYVGKTKILKLLARISPIAARNLMKRFG